MPLPQKRWFRIPEVAQRWSIPPSDVEDYALDEMLQLAVFVVGLPAEAGTWESCGDSTFSIAEDLPILNGPQPLFRNSLLEIFREGHTLVRAFRTDRADTYLHVAARAQPVIVRRDELIITREERDRFELEFEFKPAPTGNWHNEDFTRVRIDTEWETLGSKQAAVIQRLKEAGETGEPWCDGKRLLEEAGSDTLRLVDLFKRKPVWRHLVATDGKGRYRLNAVFLSSERRKIRLFRKSGGMLMTIGGMRHEAVRNGR